MLVLSEDLIRKIYKKKNETSKSYVSSLALFNKIKRLFQKEFTKFCIKDQNNFNFY